MTSLMQLFKKVTRKPKTPEQIQKEMQEEMMKEKIGLTEEDIQYIENPLFTAQINFETFKSIFKHHPEFRKSKNGRIQEENFKITRMRESDAEGNVSKSMDSIRVKKSPTSIHYMEMANRAFGIKAHCDDHFVYFNYDVITIDKVIARSKKKNDKL